MELLSKYTPSIDIYSIDEAFLDFNYLPNKKYYQEAFKIRKEIENNKLYRECEISFKEYIHPVK